MKTSPKGLEVGDKLTQQEIESAFDTGFGYRISGINPRRDEQDRRYILLFANEDGPYNDSVTEGRFEYIGEGLEGDQSKDSTGNSALIDAQSSDIPVHFFYKQAENDAWEYQGLVDVIDHEFRQEGGRELLVFTMANRELRDLIETFTSSGPSLSDLLSRVLNDDAVDEEKTRLKQVAQSEPELTENKEYTDSQRVIVDSAFQQLVRDAYNANCAICGNSRESPNGNPEVEAAHIYPKRKNGVDNPRNGIALCKLHHWAFDSGWMSLSDEYEILVSESPSRDGYHEFKQFEGNRIRLPDEEDARPHPMFLEEHRKLHGFTDD